MIVDIGGMCDRAWGWVKHGKATRSDKTDAHAARLYVGSFARVKTEGAPKQYPARCEYKDGGARDGVPTAKYLTSAVPGPRSAHTTRGGGSLTVALRDCLDPLWGVLACLSDGLVAPGFAGKVGLLHERLEPVAQEVVEAEDGVACVAVSNAVGYMQGGVPLDANQSWTSWLLR